MKRFIMVLIVLFLGSSAAVAEDLENKKDEAKKKMLTDRNFITVGALPNNTGTVDGFLGGQLFYSTRLFSTIRVGTFSFKQDDNGIDTLQVTVSNKHFLERQISVQSDIVHYRLVNNVAPERRFTLGVAPFVEYTYNKLEKTESFINTNFSQLFHEQYSYHLVEILGKAAVDFRVRDRLLVQGWAGAGMFFGKLDQLFITFDSDISNYAEDRSDTSFTIFGWAAGFNFIWNPGVVTLSLSGSFSTASGPVTMIFGGSPVELPDFKYYRWQASVELTLNFVKLGGAHPALFYGINSFAFTDGTNPLLTTIDDSTGKKVPLIHNFGVTLKI